MKSIEFQGALSYMHCLPCGDPTLPPLVKELELEGIWADETQRYGDVPVLNTEYPTNEVNQLLIELEQGSATIVREGPREHIVIDERFRGKFLVVKGEITYLGEADPGELEGWFIAEEFTEGSYNRHPFLLLSPNGKKIVG